MNVELTRRRFLVATGAFVVGGFASYSSVRAAFGSKPEPGRLKIPMGSPSGRATVGLQKLGQDLLYVPSSYRANEPLPLLVLLHKATGTSSNWFPPNHKEIPGSVSVHADNGPFIIFAPQAPGNTWGAGPKTWGYDYVAINRALEAVFARCPIDRTRLAIGGFSDGASYALSLGLANGDLFGNVIAFSPGYIVGSIGRGKPLLFIGHGVADPVLPIAVTSRVFVASLRRNGYSVDFQEFSGGHKLPPAICDQAMGWLKKNWKTGTLR